MDGIEMPLEAARALEAAGTLRTWNHGAEGKKSEVSDGR